MLYAKIMMRSLIGVAILTAPFSVANGMNLSEAEREVVRGGVHDMTYRRDSRPAEHDPRRLAWYDGRDEFMVARQAPERRTEAADLRAQLEERERRRRELQIEQFREARRQAELERRAREQEQMQAEEKAEPAAPLEPAVPAVTPEEEREREAAARRREQLRRERERVRREQRYAASALINNAPAEEKEEHAPAARSEANTGTDRWHNWDDSSSDVDDNPPAAPGTYRSYYDLF